jgi:hypothetical protein
MLFNDPEPGAEADEPIEDEMSELNELFWTLQLIARGQSQNRR